MTTKKKTSAVAQKTPVNSAVPTRVLRTGAKPAGFYNESTLFRAAIQAPLRPHAGGKKDAALAQPRRIYRLQKPQRTTENHSAPARTDPCSNGPLSMEPFRTDAFRTEVETRLYGPKAPDKPEDEIKRLRKKLKTDGHRLCGYSAGLYLERIRELEELLGEQRGK